MSCNKLIRYAFVTAICLIANGQLMAQFTITGEIRPRAEFRNGFKTLRQASDNPAFFIEQRSRLYFNYASEKILFNLTSQNNKSDKPFQQ